MAVYKLNIDEFDDIDYQLIAIHTSLEDYRLAFFINQNFPVLLRKNDDSIQITSKSGSATLSRFSFEDESTCTTWDLVQNKSEIAMTQDTGIGDLFTASSVKVSAQAYLLPEFKKVDYLLKLQHLDDTADNICDTLQKIGHITMSYTLDTNKIKSINNLIF